MTFRKLKLTFTLGPFTHFLSRKFCVFSFFPYFCSGTTKMQPSTSAASTRTIITTWGSRTRCSIVLTRRCNPSSTVWWWPLQMWRCVKTWVWSRPSSQNSVGENSCNLVQPCNLLNRLQSLCGRVFRQPCNLKEHFHRCKSLHDWWYRNNTY